MKFLTALSCLLLVLFLIITGCPMDSAYLDELDDKMADDKSSDDQSSEDEEELPAYGVEIKLEITLAGDGSVTVLWEVPDDPDFAHVELVWGVDPDSRIEIVKPLNQHIIENVTTDTELTITGRAVSTLEWLGVEDTISIVQPADATIIYCIDTYDEFVAIGTDTDTLGRYYILTEEIDLTPAGSWDGFGSGTENFTGTLDGNNNTVDNLYINASASNNQGLFEIINGGTIRNLNITNAQLNATGYMGILAGNTTDSVISNCSVQGSISCSGDYVGGLIGNVTDDVNIVNCSASVQVNGTSTTTGVGGLVGLLTGTGTKTLTRCSSSGAVTGNSMVGGLVGSDGGAVISYSFSTADVNALNTTAGGLAGEQLGGSITKCYASGNVSAPSGQANNDYVGGLVGLNSSSLSNSYATGNVSGDNYLGGLAGYNNNGIDYCYAVGAVPGASNGGICIDGGMVNFCYYDTDTTGQTETTGTPLTTLQMKQQSSYSGWDFSGIWSIDGSINNGYPYLQGMAP